MNPNIKNFEKRLKIKIKNKSLLIQALTHKSTNQEINNERLEFLGDRVIGLVLSNKLFDIYPKETEGVLDKRFAKLVNRKTCASLAWSIGIKDFIIMGDTKKKIIRKDEKILSDACEAIIGAIFVDRGYNYVKELVLRLWKQDINKSHITILDPKLAILDETDSGLDIDALRIVADGVNALRSKERSFLIITHYQRLLDYIKPDFVHVLVDGKIAKTGCGELALELEKVGYKEMGASK